MKSTDVILLPVMLFWCW